MKIKVGELEYEVREVFFQTGEEVIDWCGGRSLW